MVPTTDLEPCKKCLKNVKKMKKKKKIIIIIIIKKKKNKDSVKRTCTSSDHDKDTCKISEGLVKNCRKSCAHKVPTINSEPRTTNHAPPTTESRILCPRPFRRKGGGQQKDQEFAKDVPKTVIHSDTGTSTRNKRYSN